MSVMSTTSAIDHAISTNYMSANGLRFEVDMCGDQSSKKLAICLHGFPEHSVSWRNQLPMLAELGYKAWAPNMRGYGNSSIPPDKKDYAIENLLADIAGLIDAAECDETVLLAHDWGAVIAWYFAIRKVRPLSKLVICNVPHPGAAAEKVGWSQLKKSWYIFFFQIPRLPEWLANQRGPAVGQAIQASSSRPEMYSNDVLALYTENAARPGRLKAMINYYRQLVLGGGAKRQRDLGFPIIKTPTLMCWGEDDFALNKEMTFGTDKWVTDFTMRYLPRISHWVQQDAPVEVNAMIKAFILEEPVPEMRWEPTLANPSRECDTKFKKDVTRTQQ
ncbi:MAG: alpha/beta hydrolase [Halioglobus sp.]|nr:alpha/beta hydrolase [Halioglobus sp.]